MDAASPCPPIFLQVSLKQQFSFPHADWGGGGNHMCVPKTILGFIIKNNYDPQVL